MSAVLYIEGGETAEDKIRCRQAFREIFDKAGFTGRLPKMVASGSRNAAFEAFKDAEHDAEFIALLIDSEDPVQDPDATWQHLKLRDNWDKPSWASDENVIFMTTCMETWIVADRAALSRHYRQHLQESALPPLQQLETRKRHELHEALVHATRNCSNAYRKGKRSFEILAKLNPAELSKHLPSFARAIRILNDRLA